MFFIIERKSDQGLADPSPPPFMMIQNEHLSSGTISSGYNSPSFALSAAMYVCRIASKEIAQDVQASPEEGALAGGRPKRQRVAVPWKAAPRSSPDASESQPNATSGRIA